jgi:hypothetical protein
VTTLKRVPFPTALPIYYVGPDLDLGPLPSVFYFALSAKDTLCTAPFNQPSNYLIQQSIRVFSVDLPFHGEGWDHMQALQHWAKTIEKEESTLWHFILTLQESISSLFRENILLEHKTGVMGLSRGGFIASHVAALFSEIPIVLAYAPLTQLPHAKDFQHLLPSPLIDKLDLSHLTPVLAKKKVRVHIGNRDIRVSTDSCYQWIRSLTESAHRQHIKSPSIELLLQPSIGYQGHGTSEESFEGGAAWMQKQLLL